MSPITFLPYQSFSQKYSPATNLIYSDCDSPHIMTYSPYNFTTINRFSNQIFCASQIVQSLPDDVHPIIIKHINTHTIQL